MTEEELLQPKTFRDTIANVDKKSGKRKWVFALKPSGMFYKYRTILAWLYLLVFLAIPFIKINGHPMILINVVESKFVLFGKVFWPQDFFLFAIGMIAFIVFIVLFTVVFGRLFCGWVCPQTIFMEFYFRKIEWWIEGKPLEQKKLNDEPWTNTKIIKKVTKHFLFILFSLLIAHTFLSYIIGIENVLKIVKEGIVEHAALFFGLLFFTFLFNAVFAFIRDIVCTTICPYGRLQGVMFDKNTLLVAYDYKRGEPRGFLKKNEIATAVPKGDCVDCGMCVKVCPTGIDIRNGVQLDCVNCTACIDACDNIMEKIGKPRGLVRYASENEIAGGSKFAINGRAKAYIGLLLSIVVLLSALIITRKNIELKVFRAKGQTYTEANGIMTNIYEVKVLNKTLEKLTDIKFTVTGLAAADFKIVGESPKLYKDEAITKFIVMVNVPSKNVTKRSNKLLFKMYQKDKKIASSEGSFLGPF